MKLDAELEIPVLFLVIFRADILKKALKGSSSVNFHC